MKTTIALLVLLFNVTAFAGTPVHSSIYMAAGAGSANYFKNMKELLVSIEAAGHPNKTLQGLSMMSASVEGTEVTYHFSKVETPSHNYTCILSTTFTVDTTTQNIYDIDSKYSCDIDRD